MSFRRRGPARRGGRRDVETLAGQGASTDRNTPGPSLCLVRVEPEQGWLGEVRVARARVLCPPGDDGLVLKPYAGAGYQFQPLLSFAALNLRVSQKRW